ncbi:MAG: hypothetical protein QOF97_877 [Acidimicrobiaceae bacterium]
MLVVGCSGGPDKGASTSPSSTRPRVATTIPPTAGTSSASTTFAPQPLDFQSCGRNIECATLTVPLDYSDPTGPTIDLAINRAVARDGAHRIGALLVNPGGPGASGLVVVQGELSAFPSEVRDRFDIVGFDPRGVGKSNEVPCAADDLVAPFRHADSTPDTPEEQAELDRLAQAIAADCADKAGELLPHVGTDDAVRDIDSIRRALGEDTISFAGFSYGTLLGLRYAELFPTAARAIMLDGVVDPGQGFVDYLREQARAFETQLNTLFAQCPTGGGRCPDGGAAAAYDELARRVETNPLPAGSSGTVGPNELATAATEATYSSSGSTDLFQALAAGLAGDGTLLYELFQSYASSVHFASYAGVECIDGPHPVGPIAYRAFAAEVEKVAPRMGGSVANELLPCAFWPAPVKSVVGPVAAHGAPPILVVGNTHDAATPYEQAQRVASGLERATLLTFDSAGHTAFGTGNPCILDAMTAYLVDLRLPPEGTICSP